jgi:hypothetical protein
VGEQGRFLVGAELVVEVDEGGVLDVALLVGDLEAVADLGGVDQGHEGLGGAEQAGVDQRPGRVAGLTVQVELADGPGSKAMLVLLALATTPLGRRPTSLPVERPA